MSKQVREIRVGPTPGAEKELRRISAQLGLMNKQVDKLGTSASIFNRAFSGLFAFFGTRQLMNFADEIQMTQDRMNSLLGSVQRGEAAFRGLTDMASRTRATVAGLGTIFNRVAISTQRLGIDTQTMLDITETLQNSFRMSGATQQEAVATTIQLSQAFQSTALQGQELRSVMEQNAPLAKLILDNFSRPGETIFKTAEKGVIKINKLIPLILAQQEEWSRKAQEIGITYDQATSIALDKLKIKISQLNRELGLTEKFFKAILFAVENINTIVAAAGIYALFKGLNKAIAVTPKYLSKIVTSWQTIVALITSGVALSKMFIVNMTFLAGVVKGLGVLGALKALLITPFALALGKIALVTAAIVALGYGIYKLKGIIEDSLPGVQNFFGVDNAGTRDLKAQQLFFENRDKWQKEYLNKLNQQVMTQKQIEQFEKDSLKRARDLINLRMGGSVGSVPTSAPMFFNLNRGLEGRGPLRDLGTTNLDRLTDPMAVISRNARTPFQFAGDEVKDEKQKEQSRLNFRRELLSKLNKELMAGRMALSDYQVALMDFDRSMMNFDLMQGNVSYFEKLRLDNEQALNGLRIAFQDGTTSMQDFFSATDANAIEALDIDLKEAKISLIDFRREVFGLRGDLNSLSASDWAEAMGIAATNHFEKMRRTGQQMVSVLEGAFDSLSDTIVDGIKRNDIAWTSFLQNVLDGIAKVLIQQQIVNPLASGVMNLFQPGQIASVGGSTMGSFPVSSKATDMMPMMASKPEMNVVVNNMASNTEVEAQQKTDANGMAYLEVMIKNKVQQSLADGSMDRVMASNYGVKRKGF